jgi:hypothetical protein
LGEKALTFASTATAGIEDPDNETGKLWLDTDAEMRLTDTAGEDWYVTKSTSTDAQNDTSSRIRAWLSGNQVTNNATWTPILFNEETFDGKDYHSTSVDLDRFTIPAGGAGIYGLHLSIRFDPESVGIRAGFIMKNSTTVTGNSDAITQVNIAAMGDTTNAVHAHAGTIYELSSGDFVMAAAFQNSGSTVDLVGSFEFQTHFEMIRIGPA